MFSQHHYLTRELNGNCHVHLIFWDEVLIGFHAYVNAPHGSYKFAYRGHRLVILPDYQNLGIGTEVMDFFGKWFLNRGEKFLVRSTHLRLMEHCRHSKAWRESNFSEKATPQLSNEISKYKHALTERVAYSFEYVGDEFWQKPMKEIIIDEKDSISEEELLELKKDYYLVVVTGKPKEKNKTEKLCRKLGIRTEQLYINNKGKLVKKKKYENS